MKNLNIIFSLLVLAGSIASCRKLEPLQIEEPKSNSVFQLEEIPEIKLELNLNDWNKLLTNFDINPQNEEYVPAVFKISGQGATLQLDSIGIKPRGNTSRRRPEGSYGQLHNTLNPNWNHCHFGLDFGKYKNNQEYKGLEKMILKWFKDDANYVREIYSYDLFRKFGVWTAARASYARLTIQVKGDSKPAYYGVYGMIENVDVKYINYRKNLFGGEGGNLWKCTYSAGGPANLMNATSMGVESVKLNAANSKYYSYDLKTNKSNLTAAKAQFTEFITQLNTKTGANFEQWISNKMNVNLFLKTMAVNVMLGMWDDYWGNGNNYYLYFSPNGKVYFIPYDYDNSLGTSLSAGFFNTGTQNLLTWGKMNESPLITKILKIEKYRLQYQAYITELADSRNALFNAESSMERIAKWQNKIAPYVSNDTGEDMSIQDLPAPWATDSYYRLLSGNDEAGQNGPANYFKTRIKNIGW